MSVFFEIPSWGQLTIDQVIFETYYPILFTCVNEKNELFLAVCCQANENGKKWLITKTDPAVVISMLKDEITIREAFLRVPDNRVTVRCVNENEKLIIDWNNEEDWNNQTSRSLPDAGEYLEAEEGEFDEEIAYYASAKKKEQNMKMLLDKHGHREYDYFISWNSTEMIFTESVPRREINSEVYLELWNFMLKYVACEIQDKTIFTLVDEDDMDELLIAA